MSDAPSLERKRLLDEKSAVALRLVGRWSVPMWWRIVRGDPPPEFADYSPRRVAVLERACLICLDVTRERLPDDPDAWTEEPLTQRVNTFKTTFAYQQAGDEGAARHRRDYQAGFNRSTHVGTLAGRLPRIIVTTDPWRDQ